MHDGVIHSDARMTYTDVNAILTDRNPEVMARYEALVPMFERMHELFDVLHARRRRRGSIDFDLKESEIVLDDEGRSRRSSPSERNVAHRLDRGVHAARQRDGGGAPRAHRHARALSRARRARSAQGRDVRGVHLDARLFAAGRRRARSSRATSSGSSRRFTASRRRSRSRSCCCARCRRRGTTPANLGHFGLAAEAYTHFTSPIRRYPGPRGPSAAARVAAAASSDERRDELAEDLPEIGRHTSERERRANDAERELVQWKKVRFMADKVGDEFEGYVTGVSAYGLYLELVEHFVEGMVHVSTMADDYYRFVERAHVLRGEKNGRVYRLGDRVKVQVIRVDLERRQIDLGVSEILDAVRVVGATGAGRGGVRPGRRTGAEAPHGRERTGRPGRRERAGRKARERPARQ